MIDLEILVPVVDSEQELCLLFEVCVDMESRQDVKEYLKGYFFGLYLGELLFEQRQDALLEGMVGEERQAFEFWEFQRLCVGLVQLPEQFLQVGDLPLVKWLYLTLLGRLYL